MKNFLNEMRLKGISIMNILAGKMTLYLPVEEKERVGYVHIEVVSKDCEEIVNEEINLQNTENQQK